MTPEDILGVALAASALIGLVVFISNRRRGANQAFFVLTLTIAAWLGSVLAVFRSHTEFHAANWIRMASISGAFLPVAMSTVRVSAIYPDLTLLSLARRIPVWFGAYLLMVIYCLTPLYLLRAEIPAHGVPNAKYGILSVVFPIYLIGGFLWVLISLLRDLRTARGIVRVELEYILAGLCCLVGTGIFATVVPLITHNSQIVSLAPLWCVAISLVIAYGIATQSILSVGTLLRRTVSYSLLVIYLGLVYFGALFGMSAILSRLSIDSTNTAPVVAAICVTISVGRAQSVLQVFVRKLFINLHQIDLRSTLKTADLLLTQVTTTDELLERFLSLVGRAAGSDLVMVCLFDQNLSSCVWSTQRGGALQLSADVFAPFSKLTAPFSLLAASRKDVNTDDQELTAQLRTLSGSLAVPFGYGSSGHGVVILGEKRTGRVFDYEEQESIQLLMSRLGIALENALLYTSQRRSKEYLQSLLRQLTSGVLACDQFGIITVCNDEAKRLLGECGEFLIGRSINELPSPLLDVFLETLEVDTVVRDRDGILIHEGRSVPIRYSGQVFADAAQGAVIMFSDLTQVKELEEQLRRADRLSMLGTLSAGLAHEIRNPLAPIKTFVALIPERFNDAAFLTKFTKIVGKEVNRIERLVTQLLSFSKTSEPHRQEVDCHEIIRDVLALLSHDLVKRNIDMKTDLSASNDRIFADRQQLEQVILNGLMNAMEAINYGGNILLTTQYRFGYFELSIADDGPGIPSEVLPSIFDPFVTTKKSGTGLGLSIVYGIITEHGGTIDITNQEKGARMLIRIPTLPPDGLPA